MSYFLQHKGGKKFSVVWWGFILLTVLCLMNFFGEGTKGFAPIPSI